MKKLVIVAVVLAVILLAAPFAIGRLAESRVNAGLDKLVQEAPYLKITERTWSGGWFTSTQTVTLELSDTFKKAMDTGASAEPTAEVPAEDTESAPDADGVAAEAAENAIPEAAETAAGLEKVLKSERLTIRNEVLHGPILGTSGFGLARVKTFLVLDENARKEIAEIFGDQPALEMSTRVGFFGGGKTTFKSQGRKLNNKEGKADVSYDTFKLAIGYSKNFDSYNLDGVLPNVTVKEPGKGDFTLDDLTLVGDSERVLGDIYDGSFAFRVKEIRYTPASGESPVLVQGAHYEGDVATKDDLTNVYLRMGSGAVKMPQLDMVGFEIQEIHYDFSLRKLHAPTFNKIMQSMRDMYSIPLEDEGQIQKNLVQPMKEGFGELLAHDPEFGIDRVGFVTADGEFVAKGVVKIVGATLDDFSLSMMGLMSKLDADITIEAATKVVEKFPNGASMAGVAVDQGWAKRDGDKLVSRITFKAGELLVNGKPAPVPGLSGPPPDAGGGMEEGAMDESEAVPLQ